MNFNSKAFKTLARSDAVYASVGTVTFILELALFATNKKFGAYALESFFILLQNVDFKQFRLIRIESTYGY